MEYNMPYQNKSAIGKKRIYLERVLESMRAMASQKKSESSDFKYSTHVRQILTTLVFVGCL